MVQQVLEGDNMTLSTSRPVRLFVGSREPRNRPDIGSNPGPDFSSSSSCRQLFFLAGISTRDPRKLDTVFRDLSPRTSLSPTKNRHRRRPNMSTSIQVSGRFWDRLTPGRRWSEFTTPGLRMSASVGEALESVVHIEMRIVRRSYLIWSRETYYRAAYRLDLERIDNIQARY